MKYTYIKLILFILILNVGINVLAQNGNPIVKDFGMADPHCYIFNGKAYLFTTRDADKNAKSFIMPDWHIFSSLDLVNWKHETTIYPSDTYMGVSNNCWATETVEKNGEYYFYFSNANRNIGVMKASRPEGPYKDILHHPLISESATKGKEYDPTLLKYKDNYYIMFGHYVKGDTLLSYHIARLNQNMISLAEKPRKVEIYGDKNVLVANDKPNLHFHNGFFYLSAGSHYAISKNIYGPYKRIGDSGNGKYGLGPMAHGNYFTKDNQWFHTWCCFFMGKETARFRESYMTYLHYKDNGEMVTDTKFLDEHFECGIGRYDANWKTIEAEWFMKSSNANIKKENSRGGFVITDLKHNDFVEYPNFKNLNTKKDIIVNIKSSGNGEIIIREDNENGRVIGKIDLNDTNNEYKNIASPIHTKKSILNLYFCFIDNNINISIDNFRFE